MQNDSDMQQTVPGSLTSAVADISFEEVQQAERTIRRLKRGNPVRKLARDVMNRRAVENVQPLLKSLSDPTRPGRERQIAAWALGWTSLDAAQKQAAADVLRDCWRKSRRRTRRALRVR
jgi:hypothetical protein